MLIEGRHHTRVFRAVTFAAPVVLLLVVLSMSGSIDAAAQDLPDVLQYNGWQITGFEVEGMPDGMTAEIKRGLAQTGRWRLLGGKQRPDFQARQLAEDIARLRLYLAQKGYPSSSVQPEFTADEFKRQVKILLRVDPGEPVRIGKVELVGWPEGVARPDSTHELVVRKGEILEDQRVIEGLLEIRRILLDAGYATVGIEHELAPMGPLSVGLVVNLEPGDFYTIDEIEIVNVSPDLEGVARRVMNIKPGTPYSQKTITDASLDLRTTQLFRLVVLKTSVASPGSLKLTADLENGRMKSLDASVGTWSDNPWMVRGGWTHRNLFKQGVGFDVRGVVASHRVGASTGVFWLGWLSPRARTRAGLGFLVEDEDAYRSEEASIDIVQSFRPRKRGIWNFGITVSNTQVEEYDVSSSDEDIPETQGRLLEFWTDRKWDWTIDPLFPRQGGYFKVRLTYAPPVAFSEVPYMSAQVDGGKYLGITDDIVFATRGRIGVGEPLGDTTEIIATRRFYAGGYNTHRGYERRKLGPKDSEGNARGGEFVVLAGAELRMPLLWKFDLAAFIDAGNLWEFPSDFQFDDIPVAVGLAIDFRTPLGPLRVGYGHNIASLVEGEPRGLWHFGIGYPW